MIKKEIKEYKQGNDTVQRINILKRDNIKDYVYILEIKEYEHLQNKIESLEKTISKQDDELKQLYIKIENLENNNKTLKELNQNQYKTIEKLDQQHIDQLKQSYEQFNNEIKKYLTVNQLQNTALKQILEIGFIDLIRNKHKKIAKDQIKELTNDKKVYELTANIKEW